MRKFNLHLFPLLLAIFMLLSANIVLALNTTWTGNVSTDWHTEANWSSLSVPLGTDNVLIPAGLTVYPLISSSAAECLGLALQQGATLGVSGTLTVNGNASIAGLLTTTGYTTINLFSTITWEAGSTANLSSDTYIKAYGNWTFNAGSAINPESATVYFEGTADSWIFSHEDNSSFHNFSNHKVPPASVNISGASTNDLHFTGNFFNQMGKVMNIYSDRQFILQGPICCDSGFIHAYAGSFVAGGDPQYPFAPAEGSFFNSIYIDISNYHWDIMNTFTDTLIMNSSMTLYSGSVDMNDLNLRVGLNFVDENYGLNFINGAVIFNGDYPEQVVEGGSFHKLVINKPLGGNVIFLNDSVFSEIYDWMAGGMVIDNCRVIFNQLADNGLAGSFTINSGQLDLNNFAGSGNLLGNVTINNGTLRVYAEQDTCYWPAADNCSLTMLDGLLEFHGVSLNLTHNPGYTFNCNIQGGFIKVSNHLIGNNPLFRPEHGGFGIHVSGKSNISCVEGFAFNNLVIEKCPGDTVIALNNLHINGNFSLAGGSFLAPDSIIIKGNWNNLSGLNNFIPQNGAVVFAGTADSYLNSNEIFHDLFIKKSSEDTARFYLTNDHNLLVTGKLSILKGSMNMRMNTNLSVSGNVYIAPQAGLISYATTDNNLVIGGNWNNANTTAYNNYRGFKPCHLVVFNGSDNQSVTSSFCKETFNNLLINKPSGSMVINNDLDIYNSLDVNQGIWYNNQPGLTFTLGGNFITGVNSYWNGSENPAILDFSGLNAQEITFNGGGYLSGIRINKTILEFPYQEPGGVSMLTDVPCPFGMLVINTGKFNLNGNMASFGSGVLLTTTAATLEVDTGSVLKLGPAGLNAQMGRVYFEGELGNESLITHLGNGYFHFYLENGFISASHSIFEFMDTLGIAVGSGTGIHAVNSFRNCTFQNGEPGGTLLSLAGQSMIALQVNFPENTWGSAHNVAKYSPNGTAHFVGSTGSFSGELFDNDPFDNVNWHGEIAVFADADPHIIYTGDTSQLSTFVAGGTPPYTFAWTPPIGLNTVTGSAPKASPPVTTTYTVSVTDNNGLTDTDTITLFVIMPPGASVSGNILYFSVAQQPLDSVVVLLMNNNAPVDSAHTNNQGFYSFPFVESGTYTLACLSNIPWGGVNAADALQILKHYVGMITLSGMLFEAADVNNSGNLNTIDALMVARRFTGFINSFPVGNWAYNYPASLTVNTENIDLDFRGICYGDITMSYLIQYKLGPGLEIIEEQNEIACTNHQVSLPLRMNKAAAISSVSLALEYSADAVQIENVIMNNGEVPVFKCSGGIFRVAWYGIEPMQLNEGDVLMELKLTLLNPVVGEWLSVSPGSELTDADAQVLPGIILQYPRIRVTGHDGVNTCYIYPNPCQDALSIRLSLEEESNVCVKLYNASGSLISGNNLGYISGGDYSLQGLREKRASGFYYCVVIITPKNKGTTRIERIPIIFD